MNLSATDDRIDQLKQLNSLC